MKRDGLIVLALLILTAAAFWGVSSCGFVDLDDDFYVVNNPQINGKITAPQVRWAFTTFYQGNYLPLTWLSLMLDARFFGLGPRGFHLVNAAFHAINAILLYAGFRRATGDVWRSALLAAIFAVHPLRVESVAWIVERKDVLTAFFGLMAMLLYVQYTRSRRVGWYLATIVLFAAALLSKQTLATLPFLLLLLDVWPLGRWTRGPASVHPSVIQDRRSLTWLILEKVPLLAMVVVISIVTIKAQATTGSVVSLEAIPLLDRLKNTPISYVRYLGRMVWFSRLAVYYPRVNWSTAQVIWASAFLIAVSVISIWRWRRWPWFTTGWLWFLGVLVPMIGIVQFAGQSMADRFTYIAGIGVLVMVIWSIPTALARRSAAATGSLVLTTLGVLVIFTLTQISYWQNSITLFDHDLKVAGSAMVPEVNLGTALAKGNDLEGAVIHFRKAIVHSGGTDAISHFDLAVALMQLHKKEEAASHLFTAIRLKPDYAHAHVILAMLLNDADNYKEAENECRAALQGDTRLVDGHNQLGIALAGQGRFEESVKEFKIALAGRPDSADARENLARATRAQHLQRAAANLVSPEGAPGSGAR